MPSDPARAAAPSDPPRVAYVAGYWRLPGNAKRPAEHYQEQIPRSLAMIAGQPLRLFHDDEETARHFAALCDPLGIALHAERIPVEALPAFAHAEAYVAACRAMPRAGAGAVPARNSEKGHVHYIRDLIGSGEATYRALLAIWLSKVALAARVAADPPAGAAFVAWMDVSVARFSGQRTNWDFPRQPFAPAALNHYASPMRYLGARLPLNASLMLATPEVWTEVALAFEAQLLASRSDAYAHDEETLLGLVHRRRPELFHTLGVPNVVLEADAAPRSRRLVRALKRRLAAVVGRG